MAKRFGGFTPEQLGKIIPEMQGMQADEQARFLASQPGAAARVGKMAEVAQKRIGMAAGGMATRQGFNSGALALSPGAQPPDIFDYSGLDRQMTMDEFSRSDKRGVTTSESRTPVDYLDPSTGQTTKLDPALIGQYERYQNSYGQPGVNPTSGTDRGIEAAPFDPDKAITYTPESYTTGAEQPATDASQSSGLDTARQGVADANTALQAAIEASQLNPEDAALAAAITTAQAAVTSAQQKLGSAEENYKILNNKSSAEVMNTALNDPSSLTTSSEVENITTGPDQTIDPTTGQLEEGADTADLNTTSAPTDVEGPTRKDPIKIKAETSASSVQDTISKITASTGKPSAEALVDAAQMSPEELAQLGLTVDQIAEARKVVAPAPRKVQAGELIEGSTVDMGRVKKEINFEAVTGAPSTDATVQGQLTGLMEDFEGKEPPAWAAGAMRAAASMMAARGLSASSMAGQAAIQAAMESAIPIAQMDAQTFAKFESQNLSNKQQAALFAAEKRAEFLGLEFSQEFQARVTNASKISDIANMNFTAEQQIALENARMAQTVDITNLNARNAKVMADAAAMTQLDLTNLNNRQQAQVQNAKAFLDMDMANLNNEQQTNMFKAQSIISSIFNDQAATNAATQFNASSEMQMTQFYDNLVSTVSMFNEEQANTVSMFNTGEANAVEQFNKSLVNMRQQFNASNSLVVEQANAAWYQSVATADTAAQNLANITDAKAATELTSLGFSAMIQEVRDLMSFSWQTENNNADRATQLIMANIQSEDAKTNASATKSSGFWGALGNFAAAWISKVA